MASKYVRESRPAKSISAWVILNKRGKYVATVQAHFGDGGSVLVNVWQSPDAVKRSAGVVPVGREHIGHSEHFDFQHGRAGGGGYDKFTAALSGLVIDGHVMTDHCDVRARPKPPKGRKTWPSSMTAPPGYYFANWADGSSTYPDDGKPRWPDLAKDESGWADCYRKDGLKYLEAIGYQVLSAI